MSKKLFLLFFLTLAFCCNDARAQTSACGPGSANVVQFDATKAPWSITKSITYGPNVCIVTQPDGALSISAIVYTTPTWITLSLAATQPTDGTQVWCVANTGVGQNSNPPNSILPVQATEVRTATSGTTTSAPYFATSFIPLIPTASTVASQTVGGNSSAAGLPVWGTNAAACSGAPSLTFPAGSLGTGETRTGVKVVVYS